MKYYAYIIGDPLFVAELAEILTLKVILSTGDTDIR
jgi:hypothetical protein